MAADDAYCDQDVRSWDSVLLDALANDSAGVSLQQMQEGLPAGVAERWVPDAQARGLVVCSGDLWTLTQRGREIHSPSPSQIVVGLPSKRAHRRSGTC